MKQNIEHTNILTEYTYDVFWQYSAQAFGNLSNESYYICGSMMLGGNKGYSWASRGVFFNHTMTEQLHFGARYYSSDLSVWLSVDPLASKFPRMSPYMYVRGNPIMLIDPNGMSDGKFGKWLKNIFKGKKKDPIKQEYTISGPVITAQRTEKPAKKDSFIKTKYKQLKAWLSNFKPFRGKGYGEPYYGAQKSGDPLSNRTGDAGEMQSMSGGLIEINWPFKNKTSTKKDDNNLIKGPYSPESNNYNPLPDELKPQSAKEPRYILTYTSGYGKNLTYDSVRMYNDGDTMWRTDHEGNPLDTNTRHRVDGNAYFWKPL